MVEKKINSPAPPAGDKVLSYIERASSDFSLCFKTNGNLSSTASQKETTYFFKAALASNLAVAILFVIVYVVVDVLITQGSYAYACDLILGNKYDYIFYEITRFLFRIKLSYEIMYTYIKKI